MSHHEEMELARPRTKLSRISQAETLKRRSLKAKRPSLQNCHSVKTQRPLCSFKVLGSMSHHEEMESERPSTKRSRISQVKAPSLSSSCSIGDVRSTLPISTNSVKHSASQDEDESLLLGLSLLPADLDEESLKYSDSEDESDLEDESDSDFYFSDIPDDYGYSDDVVFDYNDVVIDDDIADIIPPALHFTVAPPSGTNVRGVATNTPPIEMADAPLSISGAAREVPPRETSAKGELESGLKS